jgi:DNA-binding SARP family transcriptional activator
MQGQTEREPCILASHSDPQDCLSTRLFHLHLLGGFQLCRGQVLVRLPLAAQRLLAFLTVHHFPLMRAYVAEALWPDSSRARAGGNLRSALWQIRRTGYELVAVTDHQITLASCVGVDLHYYSSLARRLIDSSCECPPSSLEPYVVDALSTDLLPDWFDEWLVLSRERWRQLRIRALEALAERLLHSGDFVEAVDAALAVVSAEPLRESAHRLLIKIYATESNWSAVMLQYKRYRQLLSQELGVPPTTQMEEFVRGLTSR